MPSDLARAVEFAGCRDSVGFGSEPFCAAHIDLEAGPGWPCSRTLQVLALIREVRADECKEIYSALDDLGGVTARHLASGLRLRARLHRKAS